MRAGVIEREACASCREDRPRSGLHLDSAGALVCRDWYGCYTRFRAWMIRQGYWTDVAGRLYPVGRNRRFYQAVPGGPVLWAWTGEGQVEVCRI